jgi:V8-like Glu-specific endopeptidase
MGLCKTERFYDQPSGAFCSGSLIAPNLILTAGHCIRNQTACSSTSFVFGFAMKSETEQIQHFKAEDVVNCKKIISREQDGHGADYAVIEIDRAVTHIQPLIMGDNSKLRTWNIP